MKSFSFLLFGLLLSLTLQAQELLRVGIYAPGDSLRPELYQTLKADTSIQPVIIDHFRNPNQLDSLDVLVIGNPQISGLDFQEITNFETMIGSGTGLVGLQGSLLLGRDGWKFYQELIGAFAGAYSGPRLDSVFLEGYHPLTEGFPEKWTLYSRFPFYSYQDPDRILLFDAHCWYQNFSPAGDSVRSLYLPLGGTAEDYTNNPLFQRLLLRGVQWAGGRLRNPSPDPPTIHIQQPKASKVFSSYPSLIKWKLDFGETTATGKVDSLAVYVDDQLIESHHEKTQSGHFYVANPGLYTLKFEAHTDNGNWAAALTTFGLNPEPGLGLALVVPFAERYQVGDSLPISVNILNDSIEIEEISLSADEFLLASSNVAPLEYTWIPEKPGEYLLKATARDTSGLSNIDSVWITISADTEFRLNLGSAEAVILDGKPFLADSLSEAWLYYPINILGTAWDVLYQTAAVGEKLNYAFPFPNGEYTVHLHLAELEPFVADRVISVWLEEQPVLIQQSISPLAQRYSFDFTLTDEIMDLLLTGTPEAIVAGIEVLPRGVPALPITQTEQTNEAFLYVHPNPVDEQLEVHVKSEAVGPILFQFSNLAGEPLQKWEQTKTEEMHQSTLSLQKIPPGVYLLQASMPEVSLELPAIRIVKR
ncbi:MAG: ThuA domain-containing protein [Bacteroidota bacterium]